MAFARDVMRATLRQRRLQAKRNAEAMAEEEERQRQIPGAYKPKAGRKMRRTASPENKMLYPVEEDKDAPTLDDVPWASPQAYAKAVNHGLTSVDFEGREYSGRAGFTAADVTRIAQEVASE